MKVSKKQSQKRTAEWAERKRNVESKKIQARKEKKYLTSNTLVAMYA